MSKLVKPADVRPTLGCDPEFFFTKGGKVIGAEKILPKDGFITGADYGSGKKSKVIIDGVQAELNPRPNTCRASLASEISQCMRDLNGELQKTGTKANFSRVVTITKKALMSLDEKSRKFGCSPSLSISKTAGIKIEGIDPEKYRKRAAGGHIHIGTNGQANVTHALKKDYERTVAMLDILCGNTMVLVDRDKSNAERRKIYGRAGEYRLPSHGLEYRTLSNFWMTSYPLMSFAFGMARLAIMLMADVKHEEYYKAFTSAVSMDNIHKAINTNNFNLAVENFKAIEQLLFDVTGPVTESYGQFPLHEGNIKEFYHFVKMIDSKGLEYWFKSDPMTHWANPQTSDGYMGFNDFLRLTVKKELTALTKPVKAG